MRDNDNKSLFTNFDKVINVGIADMKFATPPNHLRTNLGSCVALVLYDNIKQIGGLVHVMLPRSFKTETKVGKCADTAVPAIINQMVKKNGCKINNLTAKIFGGAKILQSATNDIGQENVQEVIKLVKEHGISISAMKVGGGKGYVIQLDTSTGIVLCRIFGQEIEYF